MIVLIISSLCLVPAFLSFDVFLEKYIQRPATLTHKRCIDPVAVAGVRQLAETDGAFFLSDYCGSVAVFIHPLRLQ